MYALADASGATAMTRIIGWVGPARKKISARPARKAPPRPRQTFSLRSPNRLWRIRRESALFPHCCRIATFFRFLSRCGPYRFFSCNMRARRFLFPTIPTRRTLSVTIVTSLGFIFFMSDIRNADTFDRVFRRPAGLASRRRRHVVAARHANITAAEH